jgi:hypothetical protein
MLSINNDDPTGAASRSMNAMKSTFLQLLEARPSIFERNGSVRDLKIAIGGGDFSGTIMHDILVPTFNIVCAITRALHEPFVLQDLP